MNIAKLVITVFLVLAFACPSFGEESPEDKLKSYLNDIINNMRGNFLNGNYERAYPDNDGEAYNIIINSTRLAWPADGSSRGVIELIDRLKLIERQTGREAAYLKHYDLVFDAICKYYGFDLEKNKKLLEIAYGKLGSEGYYFYGVNFLEEPGYHSDWYNITKISKIEDDILKVQGYTDARWASEEAEYPFVAYFMKTKCRGKNYWVLIRLVQEYFQGQREIRDRDLKNK